MRVDDAVTWGGHDSSPTTRRGIENPAIAEGLEKAPWSTCMMVGHPVSSVIPCGAPTQRKDHSPLFRRCQGTVFTSSVCISCPPIFISMSSNSLGFRPRIFPFSIVLHFLYTGVPSGYSLAGTVQLDYQLVVRCHRKWTESRRSPFVRCLWRTQPVTYPARVDPGPNAQEPRQVPKEDEMRRFSITRIRGTSWGPGGWRVV